jgi:hypothetical protein
MLITIKTEQNEQDTPLYLQSSLLHHLFPSHSRECDIKVTNITVQVSGEAGEAWLQRLTARFITINTSKAKLQIGS